MVEGEATAVVVPAHVAAYMAGVRLARPGLRWPELAELAERIGLGRFEAAALARAASAWAAENLAPEAFRRAAELGTKDRRRPASIVASSTARARRARR